MPPRAAVEAVHPYECAETAPPRPDELQPLPALPCAPPIVSFLQNPQLMQELRPDKQYNIHMLQECLQTQARASTAEGETVRVSHILIKHEGSRRKASWKDTNSRIISATTRADAAARRLDLRNQILSGLAAFADPAARHSDCSSAKRGRDLAYDLVF
ncbi:hypothetical protein EJB05_51646 [Eragrostis curvula]|uniref:Peptidyl-prolyl cis-trans isomerase n=1 Tax=Eragrostis curvula TaxID=38414 RepID=A0A5J9SV42_9POAL|nr:hypothetical protein EJB05_51646 [Eragrostis curvula]